MSEMTHQPAPGGRIERSARAARQAHPDTGSQAPEQVQGLEPVEVSGTVSTKPRASDECNPRTIALAAGAQRQLIGQDPGRKRVVIIAIDNPVVLCASQSLASDPANQVTSAPSPTGGWLPVGVPVPVETTAALYVANSSSSATSRVTVIAERYAHPRA